MKTIIISVITLFITAPSLAQKAKQNQQPANADTSKQVVYTCTMHPDFISFAAAKCPVCGNNMSKKEVMKMEVMKIYTCPMDNVLCTKPEKCPICKMDMTELKPKNKSKS